jgi:hypothetical protein
MFTQAKIRPQAYLNLRHRGYAEDQIPAWFKRSIPELQASFNEAKKPALPATLSATLPNQPETPGNLARTRHFHVRAY